MRKGLIGIAIVMIFAAIALEFLILQFKFKHIETVSRTVMEASIIESINTVELIKTSLQQALGYSFYQASYDVSKTGGKAKQGQQSENGISYWRVYGSTPYGFDDFKKDLQDTTLKVFNEYATALNDPVKIPKYTEVEVKKVEDDVISVNAKSGEKLQLDAEKLYISDSANTTKDIRIRTIKLFEVADENFLRNDKIGNIAQQAVSGCGCSSTEAQIKSSVESGLSGLESSLSSSNTKVELVDRKIDAHVELKWCTYCDEDGCYTYCCGATCTASAKTLVKINDLSTQYAVYDTSDRVTAMRNILLQFYAISGASASG